MICVCLQVTAGAHDSHGESTFCVCCCCVLGKSVFDRTCRSHSMSCDLCLMQMSGDKSISAFPERDDLFKWIGTISGPQGTVSVCTQRVFYQPSRVLAVNVWNESWKRRRGDVWYPSVRASPVFVLDKSSSHRILAQSSGAADVQSYFQQNSPHTTPSGL